MLLAPSYSDLRSVAKDNVYHYMKAKPFPHIVFDGFFDEVFLGEVLAEFPDLDRLKEAHRFSSSSEQKLAGKGEFGAGPRTRQLMHYLNSGPFLQFVQSLTAIDETLLPDPYFSGGGLHEIKSGGFLKLHADFNKHPSLDLDRRVNVLVYLNEHWDENWGGDLQLWDQSMQRCVESISPHFNRMVIFSTTETSWHGHPDPLECPPERSRKSLALYYFSLGRPESEFSEAHRTVFKGRPGLESRWWKIKGAAINLAIDCTPPIVLKAVRSMRDRSGAS